MTIKVFRMKGLLFCQRHQITGLQRCPYNIFKLSIWVIYVTTWGSNESLCRSPMLRETDITGPLTKASESDQMG